MDKIRKVINYETLAEQYLKLAKEITNSESPKTNMIESLVKIELDHIQVLEELSPDQGDKLRDYRRMCDELYSHVLDIEWSRTTPHRSTK